MPESGGDGDDPPSSQGKYDFFCASGSSAYVLNWSGCWLSCGTKYGHFAMVL